MLYRTWLAIFFLGPGGWTMAQAFEPFAGPSPLAILLEKNPWDPVPGAETPRIAIYENGDVIYSRTFSKNKPDVYFYAKLDFQALAGVTDQLRSVMELRDLKPSYTLTATTEQSRTLLYLHIGGREAVTSVEGLTPDTAPAIMKAASGDQVPAALLDLLQYLDTVYFTESRPWRPALVEAMVWPEDDATGASTSWPTIWPDLKSERVIKRNQGYSIFLDGSQEEDLKKFLKTVGDKGAVEIDGNKWSVAWRPVFPGEPVWRKAFSGLEDR